MASQTYVLVIPCQLSLKVLWWFASSVTQLSSQTVSSITPSGVLTIYKRQMKPEATIPLHTALFLYIIMSCSSLSLLHQSCETCDISIGFFFLRPEQGLALLNVSIAQNFSSWACLAPSSRKLNTLQAPPQTNSTHSIRYNHAHSQSSLISTKTLSASVGFLWRISRPTDSWSGAGIFFYDFCQWWLDVAAGKARKPPCCAVFQVMLHTVSPVEFLTLVLTILIYFGQGTGQNLRFLYKCKISAKSLPHPLLLFPWVNIGAFFFFIF